MKIMRYVSRFGPTNWIASGIVVVGLGLGLWSIAPPAVVGREAPPVEFSAERAFDHAVAIAGEPHPMGSAANAAVRGYLMAELERLGIASELQPVAARDFYGNGEPLEVVNVIARLPGIASTGTVLLMAHYDTFPTTSGANDDSAAVATLLEVGRALVASPARTNDVVLLFTDGEEPSPRYGANGFLNGSPRAADLGMVANFEALGGSGPSWLVETSGPVAAELMQADAAPAAFSFVTAFTELFGEVGTDFDPFQSSDIMGAHFAYLRGSPIYHTEADSIERVNLASLQNHGSHALAIANHFGGIDLEGIDDPGELTFYSVGPVGIRHSSAVMVLVAGAGLLLAVRQLWPRGGGLRVGIKSLGFLIIGGVAGIVAGTGLWWAISALRPTVGVAEGYVYLIVVMGAGASLGAWIGLRGPGRAADAPVAVVWGLLALTTCLLLPGAGYVFAIPALAAGIALLWGPAGSDGWRLVRFGVVVLPAIILTLPMIELFWQFAQPRPGNPDSELTATVALPILVGGLVAALVRSLWPGARESGLSDMGGASITKP